jgi:hypothetical protein
LVRSVDGRLWSEIALCHQVAKRSICHSPRLIKNAQKVLAILNDDRRRVLHVDADVPFAAGGQQHEGVLEASRGYGESGGNVSSRVAFAQQKAASPNPPS